ncbi:hypothetical protein QFC21_000747 [Naganishia friedmannii]|uniref:Uncharacterized protein n=1 Tax=Naganishia friedmannii TaxID=89922 RepID=A0ACC2W9K9_9TREE|nr:hypothetical protein QFC21_000747 [Naganishia friedmannii]
MANGATPTQPLLGLIESPSRFHAARRQRAATTAGLTSAGRRSRASSDATRPPPSGEHQFLHGHSSSSTITRHGSISGGSTGGGGGGGKPGMHRLLSDLGPGSVGRSTSRGSGVDERTPLLSHPPSHGPGHGNTNGDGQGIVVNALGITAGSSSGDLPPPGAGTNGAANGTRAARSISITSYTSHHPPFILESDGNGGLITASSTGASLNGNGTTPPPSAGNGRVRPGTSSSSWRTMLRAPSQLNTPTLRVIDTPEGEAIVVTRPKKRRHPVVRYMRALWSGAHWKALFHLVALNIPFALRETRDADPRNAGGIQVLLLWPLLVVGTLTGTVLLITLPLGALIWFITLILARSACRLELKMQLFFHSPLRSSIPRPNYFPIFRRIKLSPGADGQVRPVVELYGEGNEAEVAGIVHERNFFKNCWSMFSGEHSEPLITLLSSLVIIVLVPVSAALIIPLPGALELVRRFGRWQAGVAVEGLQ